MRILVYRLPSRSPWLNPNEPKWVHGKRQVCEADRKLTASELKRRICAHYECSLLGPACQSEQSEAALDP